MKYPSERQAAPLLRFWTRTKKSGYKELQDPNITPVFVLSSGRTGTNFLGDHFNHYDNVEAIHEPKPYWQLRLWSHAYYEGKVSKDDMRNALYSLRKKPFEQISKSIYLEANPALTGFADVLTDVYPDAQIIHIMRDPRDYITSSLNIGTSTGVKGFLNRYMPFWYVDATGNIGKSDNKEMTYRVANYWVQVNENLLKQQGNKNYSFYKFEEMFDPSFSSLRDIAKKLGLEFKEDKTKIKNASRKNVKTSWQDWSNEEINRVHEICSPLMQQYGYGEEPEWLERVNS